MKRNLYKPDFEAITQIDWARLAAYIDGEGHICIAQQVHKAPFEGRGRYGYVSVVVCNTDVRLSDWFKVTFGGHVVMRGLYGPNTGRQQRWREMYNWQISNGRAAELLQKCLPHFLIKREQAEIAIAFQATCKRSGVKGTPEPMMILKGELAGKLRSLTKRGPRAVAVNE